MQRGYTDMDHDSRSDDFGDATAQTPPTIPDDDLLAEPPMWPKVVGIISIIFASIGLLCGGCGLAMMPAIGKMMASSAQNFELPPIYQFSLVGLGLSLLGIAHAGLLMGAGISTILRKPVGRKLHLIYAGLAFPMVLIGMLYQWKMHVDTTAWAQQADPNNPFAQQALAPGAKIGAIVGFAFGLVLGLSWPIFTLIWFGLVKRDAASMGRSREVV